MSALLKVENLNVSYGSNRVVNAVNVALLPGDFLAILGPNGCGKTTLLQSLLGMTHASGSIEWFGKPLASWRPRELARRVAFLPQSPTFEDGDRVIDVLKLGRLPFQGAMALETDADDAAIARTVQDLELAPLLSRRIETLSGGQRQRVYLGRMLAQEPEVLLLDEPTTFLDMRHQVELYALLERIIERRNVAVMMACHDLNLAMRHARTGMLMKDGQIVAHGTIEQTLTAEHLSKTFGVSVTAHATSGSTLFAIGR